MVGRLAVELNLKVKRIWCKRNASAIQSKLKSGVSSTK